jgi:hypothetical protein
MVKFLDLGLSLQGFQELEVLVLDLSWSLHMNKYLRATYT